MLLVDVLVFALIFYTNLRCEYVMLDTVERDFYSLLGCLPAIVLCEIVVQPLELAELNECDLVWKLHIEVTHKHLYGMLVGL